jgi:hypothetical protein
MRRITLLSTLALAVPALLGLNAGAAAADGTAPAPECDSFSSTFSCEAAVPVSSVTWTMTIRILGTSNTSTFPGPTILHSGCEVRAAYTFSYTYVSGGVTFDSPTSRFVCAAGPPE